MKRSIIYLIILSISYSQLSHAQYSPTYNPQYQNYQYPAPKPVTQNYNPIIHTPILPANNIQAGDQLYDGSISGLRSFIDEEYKESTTANNQQIYQKLNSELESLENLNKWSWVSLIAGIGAGTALVAIGSSKDCYEGRDLLAGEDPNCVNTKNIYLYSGLGLVASGTLLFYILKPSRSDMLNFINKHNKLNKNKPLKWQLGFNPNGSSGVIATFEF